RSVSTDTDVSLRRTRRDLDSNIVEKAGSISITSPKENTSSDSSHPNGFSPVTKYHDASDGWYTFVQLDQQRQNQNIRVVDSYDGYV
ncbi:hypothetical protein LAJ55_14315, partial [Streptococcus pneumoniae]